ncbi:ZIP family zinc transporter [Anaerobacterium chartisolvens]|uniref:ZIP family zinc transporter n=1 Tax=Anaerobacterium chartisolvens TaxID=1297424 RepID=A0A369B3Q2_9FIRM|nr:ZIP family metal transporter [Anaerobacterium chartisolvens]RCX14334.1 ZIP family zinc transporter [Anaerobacterium chartisolvens]
MEYLIRVTLIGLASGIIGTSIGGLMAFFINDISNRFMSLILEFSAGIMTSVVCFELIPEAFRLGSAGLAFFGMFAGVCAVILFENMLSKAAVFKRTHRGDKLLQTGILTAMGIALHNFPEGFAVGSGFEASASLGFTLTLVILIHDIPEGVAMAVPMRAGGFSKMKAFLITVLSGVPMGLGALAGAVLGELSQLFIPVCLGFAAGAMLYIVCAEIVPQSKRLYAGRLPSLGNVIGILCGILVTIYN